MNAATSQPSPEAAIDDQALEQNLLDDLPFQSCFAAAAASYDIEESLLIGIAIVESSMDPDAVSSSNAMGLMQIKWPITANHLGISEQQDLFDPVSTLMQAHVTCANCSTIWQILRRSRASDWPWRATVWAQRL